MSRKLSRYEFKKLIESFLFEKAAPPITDTSDGGKIITLQLSGNPSDDPFFDDGKKRARKFKVSKDGKIISFTVDPKKDYKVSMYIKKGEGGKRIKIEDPEDKNRYNKLRKLLLAQHPTHFKKGPVVAGKLSVVPIPKKPDPKKPDPKKEERSGQGKKKKSKYRKAPTLEQVASRQKTLTTYHFDKSPTSAVIIVQKLLNIYSSLTGAPKMKADGAFGPKTEEALKLLLMNKKFSEFLDETYKTFKGASKPSFLQDTNKPVEVDSVLLFAMATFSKTNAVQAGYKATEYADNVLERFRMYSQTPKEKFEKDLDDLSASLGDDIAKKMNESYGESRGTLYRKRYRRY